MIDEIHTPDSSRFWFERSYADRFAAGQDPESFDKEYVRRDHAGIGVKGDGPVPSIPDDVRVEAARRYIEAFETITGRALRPRSRGPARPPPAEPRARPLRRGIARRRRPR